MADRALRLGAGLAYYGLVTLIPILVLILGIVGLLIGEEAANGQLVTSLSDRLGEDVARTLADAVVTADVAGSFANLTVISALILVFTASVLFVAWKDALEVVWGVGVRPGVRRTLLNRLFGIAALGAIAALLVAVFVVEAVLAALAGLFADEALVDLALRAATSIAPLILGGMLLAVSYHFGSDGVASWESIWKGTTLTLVLVWLFLWGYGLYLDVFSNSLAGVASSILVLVVLVYFLAQVLLYGAELIKVLDARRADLG
jgi:membrane protein